jgi:hypothetical protein
MDMEFPPQGETLSLPQITGAVVLRNPKRPVKTFRTIAAVGGHVVSVREVVLAAVIVPMPQVVGVDTLEGETPHRGAGEDPVVVVEVRVRYGTPRDLGLSVGYD